MFYVMAAKLDINIEKSICFRKVFVRLAFFRETQTHKAVHTTMITPYGVKKNMYVDDYQSEVMLDDLFR